MCNGLTESYTAADDWYAPGRWRHRGAEAAGA
jgi:hypothetical protein